MIQKPETPRQRRRRQLGAFRDVAEERALLVWRIILTLLGDAAIFCVWLGVSFVLTTVTEHFKSKGLQEPVAHYFLISAHYGTLALAVVYILCDLVGVVRELRARWLDGIL